MSDVDADVPPCISCGEPMKQVTTAPSGPDTARAWYCGNPDCPQSDTDMAPLAPGQEWLNQPGTEGGANGGA